MAEASSWERQRRQEGVADREISGLGHHQKVSPGMKTTRVKRSVISW